MCTFLTLHCVAEVKTTWQSTWQKYSDLDLDKKYDDSITGLRVLITLHLICLDFPPPRINAVSQICRLMDLFHGQ